MEQFLTSALAIFLAVIFPMVLSESSHRSRNKENK